MWSKNDDQTYFTSNKYLRQDNVKLPIYHDVNDQISKSDKAFYPRGDTGQRNLEEVACVVNQSTLIEKSSEPLKIFFCFCCQNVILNQIVCAVGRAYHTECFVCHNCKRNLDGKLFGINEDGNVLCQEDYIQANSPVCALCNDAIVPIEQTGEIVRVVSMGKEFHIDCYKCQDCGMHLTDEADKRCYPLDDFLLCYFCHRDRKKPHRKVAASTEPGFFNPNVAKLKGRSTDAGIDENANHLVRPSFI